MIVMALDDDNGTSAEVASASRARVHALAIVGGLVLLMVSVAMLIGVIAERDVRLEASANLQRQVGVHLSGLHLSRTHLVVMGYDISGHPELSTAVWYLRPFGDVVVGK